MLSLRGAPILAFLLNNSYGIYDLQKHFKRNTTLHTRF
jgi:hypothetical protein